MYSPSSQWKIVVVSWSTKHFWSFTAKQCCCILLNKCSWGLVYKTIKELTYTTWDGSIPLVQHHPRLQEPQDPKLIWKDMSYTLYAQSPSSDGVCTIAFSLESCREDFSFKLGVNNIFLNQFDISGLPETCITLHELSIFFVRFYHMCPAQVFSRILQQCFSVMLQTCLFGLQNITWLFICMRVSR